MRTALWIVGGLTVLAIELLMLGTLFLMRVAENCDNGVDRLTCNDTLGVVFTVAIFVLPVGAVFIAAEVSTRRRQS